MSDKYMLDANGDPVPVEDLLEWARCFESANRRVAFDELGGGVTVSTVFLGLDHSWNGPPPILWETMVFGGNEDGYCERYSTQAEAEGGHKRVVERIRSGKALEG